LRRDGPLTGRLSHRYRWFEIKSRELKTMLDDVGLLTEEQTAQQFSLTVGTLRNWRSERRGPPAVKIGRKYFDRRETINAWVASREGAHVAEVPGAALSVRGHGRK
jgi:hypothetical protein